MRIDKKTTNAPDKCSSRGFRNLKGIQYKGFCLTSALLFALFWWCKLGPNINTSIIIVYSPSYKHSWSLRLRRSEGRMSGSIKIGKLHDPFNPDNPVISMSNAERTTELLYRTVNNMIPRRDELLVTPYVERANSKHESLLRFYLSSWRKQATPDGSAVELFEDRRDRKSRNRCPGWAHPNQSTCSTEFGQQNLQADTFLSANPRFFNSSF